VYFRRDDFEKYLKEIQNKTTVFDVCDAQCVERFDLFDLF